MGVTERELSNDVGETARIARAKKRERERERDHIVLDYSRISLSLSILFLILILTLFRVSEPKHVIIPENNSRSSPQFLWFSDKATINKCLTVFMWYHTNRT